jgi:coenzyme PQQ biosynthesis protein PqqD
MLLYPETGLELNKTATEIARLCTGERTTDDIAQHLVRIYGDVSFGEIKQDLQDFLNALAGRGLLQGLP